MNDKKKSKVVLSKDKMKDLEGFEEFMNDYFNDVETKNPTTARDHRLDDFDILNFLENEHERLEKVKVVFTSKVPNYINHPQAEPLTEIQQKKITLAEKAIIKKLISEDSPLNRNIGRLFKKMS